MKVVVTGGAGFIGANLCRVLAADEAVTDVVALDDLSTGLRANLEGVDATLVEGSILDPDALDATFAGAAGVVHLAARPSVPRSIADPMASHRANATGTMEVLEAARRAGNPTVVVASSSSVYGANPTLPKHEDLATRPLSPYAASKLATEAYALAYQHSFGLPVLAFRFFNVFGPLQQAGHAYAAVVPAFVSAALAGRPLTVHGDGTQSRDFTYVDTVARVITAAVTGPVTSPDPVNLAFGSRTDLLGVVALLEGILGRPLEVEHVAPRTGDVKHSQADSTRLHALFPDVEPVDLEEGLRATVAWFESMGPDVGAGLDVSEMAGAATVDSERAPSGVATRLAGWATAPGAPEPALIRAQPFRPYRGKRVLDLVLLAVVGLPALLLGGVCAIAVRLTSAGPVIFRQERIGLGGKPFVALKFRTMTHGDNPIFPDADRITSVGRWLRRLSLDELPQLVNVWRGEMSVVGPRPTLAYQVERYTDRQAARLCVRPGLTGLAQIRGRNALSWSERIEHDLEYVQTQSVALDLGVVVATVAPLLTGHGAEGHPTDDPLAS